MAAIEIALPLGGVHWVLRLMVAPSIMRTPTLVTCTTIPFGVAAQLTVACSPSKPSTST